MWPQEQASNSTRLFSSSSSNSKSSSSSSSASPFSSISIPPRRKTMEEVWKDITLSTPMADHHHLLHCSHPNAVQGCIATSSTTSTTSTTSNSPSFRGVILQDFLARPFKETTGPAVRPPPPASPAVEEAHQDMGVFSSPLPMPPPATVLSLNSGLDFQYMESVMQGSRPSNNSGTLSSHHPSHASSFMAPTAFSDTVGSTVPGLFSYCSKRRMSEQEDPQIDGSGGGDRRHKRMIKNRESAARSRARKQAYTNELELEVAHLAEENTKLRRQQEELRKALAAQVPTRKALYRSATAPF